MASHVRAQYTSLPVNDTYLSLLRPAIAAYLEAARSCTFEGRGASLSNGEEGRDEEQIIIGQRYQHFSARSAASNSSTLAASWRC